uniref:Si:dkeyp-122a9.2 n=1 Tax=Sinocyclocheilus rhinocerous TaxID=307959 RepID=A0A673KJ92_9TELE
VFFTFIFKSAEGKTAFFGALHFCLALIGLEKLMDQEFFCPCNPGFNMELISFIFLGPGLLALTMMMFIQRPCRRSSSHCAGLFLFSLIPPSLWMFLLLFEGKYVACGMAHWEGDYVLDKELQIKWCKPTGVRDGKVNETELRELAEKIIFFSRVSLLYNCIIFYYLSFSFFSYFVCLFY